MVDQLAAKWLEAGFSGCAELPNLRQLAEAGVTFGRAIVSNPVCSPSRASLATGLHARGHELLENGYTLDPSIPTFASMLQQAGYQTAAFGKVHLQSAMAPIWAWNDIDWFAHYGSTRRDLRLQIRRARERFPEIAVTGISNMAYSLPYPVEVSQTEWITARATEFIRSANPDAPLHAHISYVQPHDPFSPPPEYLGKVDVASLPQPLAATWQRENDPQSSFHLPPVANQDWRSLRHYYFADLAHLDAQLGRVMDAVRDRGRMDSTYIFFTSDHGELLLDHGFTGKTHRHYDACIRVPLIVTGPYFEPSNENLSAIAGKSLVPLLRGDSVIEWRDAAFTESYNNIHSQDPGEWARTLRTAEYRYTYYPAGSGEQLFDLAEDPNELHNLVENPATSAVRERFRDRLLETVVLQDRPKPPRNLFSLGVH